MKHEPIGDYLPRRWGCFGRGVSGTDVGVVTGEVRGFDEGDAVVIYQGYGGGDSVGEYQLCGVMLRRKENIVWRVEVRSFQRCSMVLWMEL